MSMPYLTKQQIIDLFAWYYHTDTNGTIRNYDNAKRSHNLQQILDRIYAEYGDDLFYMPNRKYQIEIN
jgi:hypothetical protein